MLRDIGKGTLIHVITVEEYHYHVHLKNHTIRITSSETGGRTAIVLLQGDVEIILWEGAPPVQEICAAIDALYTVGSPQAAVTEQQYQRHVAADMAISDAASVVIYECSHIERMRRYVKEEAGLLAMAAGKRTIGVGHARSAVAAMSAKVASGDLTAESFGRGRVQR